MAGACDFFPPFSFWAAIISCLLRSASSSAFFFARASASFFSASSLRSFSSSALFCWASFFSCSILISFLLACFLLAELFFFSSLLLGKLFLLLNSNLFPLSLLLLQSLEFFLFFCWASFFSCSILISFLLACFSFSLLSSSSSLASHLSTDGYTPSAGHSARPSWL